MEAVLLLGGNVGDVAGAFRRAEEAIVARIGPIRSRSRDHRTEPWGFSDERLFLNRALIVASELEPCSLMHACLAIEKDLGRVRDGSSVPKARTIDIDILFIGDQVIDQPDLRVPHPRVHERAFALGPAADVAPDLVHPLLKRTVLQLLNDVLQQA